MGDGAAQHRLEPPLPFTLRLFHVPSTSQNNPSQSKTDESTKEAPEESGGASWRALVVLSPCSVPADLQKSHCSGLKVGMGFTALSLVLLWGHICHTAHNKADFQILK